MVKSMAVSYNPGFVMVLLSAMQSGVTDNLINELRLSLLVAHKCNWCGAFNFWHHFQSQAFSPRMMVAEHAQRLSHPRNVQRR
jgi:hypothetical protein